MRRHTDNGPDPRHKQGLAKKHLKPLAAVLLAVLALPLLAMLFIAIFGWNWARAPLQRMVLAQTGRVLVIAGDLTVEMGWPTLRVQAQRVSFANPPWAVQPQMLALPSADFDVDLPALWQQKLVFPVVRLAQPVVMLETSKDGRKTWLLDTDQSNEDRRVMIGLLSLDRGQLDYTDTRLQTQLHVEVDTPDAATGNLVFKASGRFKGLPLAAQGQGGPVLALRDEKTPYPLKVDATIGRTGVRAEGHVTGLLSLAAVDLQLALRGDSLAQLFPLLGVGLPETRDYVTAGHLVRSGKTWRYDTFTGRVGRSDVAGNLQVDLAGARPMLRGEVLSQVLDFDDLAPVIGGTPPTTPTSPASPAAVPAAAAAKRVLPDIPFKTERWRAFDADVRLRAARILRAQELPLENLVAHVLMQDAVLTLQPLDFGIAGGHLKATIRLDGRPSEIVASAQVQARKILISKLFPTLVLTKTSVGQVNGEFDLTGRGPSVGRMLASADGQLRLVVEQGEISRLLMEKMGLHLLEILQLTLTGDKNVVLHCAVADFKLQRGVMTAQTLLLDTEVSTLVGSGNINLAQETLDLTLVPHTRNTSIVALRGPIHLRGSLAAPVATLDKPAIVARSAGALVLGLLNPLLALIPLVEAGPGLDSECARLLARGRAGAAVKPAVVGAANRSGAQTPR